MSAFPAPDPRYGEVLAVRQVPRDQWRNDHTWVRFYQHVCQQYRHHPTTFKSLPLLKGKLASKGPTAAQRAQARCAVEDDAMCLSPAVPLWRDDDTSAPTAPQDGADGLTARKPERVIGSSPWMEAHAPLLVQAHGAREQTHAAWQLAALADRKPGLLGAGYHV